MSLHNYALLTAYEGTHFMGWQKTDSGPFSSVEAMVEKALSVALQHPVSLQAASRTDRGVHAAGQVINFFTDKEIDSSTFAMRINSILAKEKQGRDIAILAVEKKNIEFHPTLDAIGKEYHYHIALGRFVFPHLRHTHWHLPQLDIEAMKRAARDFLGTHDFQAFCNFRKGPAYENTIRTLSRCDVKKTVHGIVIELEGNHFLYKMARNIVGTLAYIGVGKLPENCVSELLEKRDRTLAGITAPAHGLTLFRVMY